MDFPNFAPDGAWRFAERFLQDSPEPSSKGLETLLSATQAEIKDINEKIIPSLHENKAPEPELNEWRWQKKEKIEYAKQLELGISVIHRLICDERMKDAYRDLSNAFSDDEDRDRKIDKFLHAAYAALTDYSRYRERIKRAQELTGQIAEKAKELADLLRRIRECGHLLPLEFERADELLRRTDNTENPEYPDGKPEEFYMWRGWRHTILGDRSPAEDGPQAGHDSAARNRESTEHVPQPGEQPETDPAAEENRKTIRYVWRLAPPVAALLDTLADTAQRYKPAEFGSVRAAIASRKTNIKTTYLRAFAYKLSVDYEFELTRPILHAMATTADVVLSDEDISSTYDDVRKAVESISKGGRFGAEITA
jgi:hypothetical protein